MLYYCLEISVDRVLQEVLDRIKLTHKVNERKDLGKQKTKDSRIFCQIGLLQYMGVEGETINNKQRVNMQSKLNGNDGDRMLLGTSEATNQGTTQMNKRFKGNIRKAPSKTKKVKKRSKDKR